MAVHDDVRPRRTFAVISHPDAGKSTLTEALALHAAVISEAGAVHGKAGRRATVSDWMEMEQARGISITSAALQFTYREHVVNLVDTPGHADFSEDTYRVLVRRRLGRDARRRRQGPRAADPEALPGLRAPRHPGDHDHQQVGPPGLDPLELMDSIEKQIKLKPTPLTWPVGDRRRLPRRPGPPYRRLHPLHPHRRRRHPRPRGADGPASRPPRSRATPGPPPTRSTSCSAWTAPTTTRSASWPGETTPVLFASALLNFGVAQLLEILLELAPPPADAPGRRRRRPRAVDERLQRLRLQGAVRHGLRAPRPPRLRPGLLGRLRARHGRHPRRDRPPVRHQVRPGRLRPRAVLGGAGLPGDVIGLVNASALRVGDTIYAGEPVRYPPIASFAPEHFATVPRRRHRPLQAVPQRHRAARPGGRGPGAALGPARRPEPRAGRGRADAVRGRRSPGWRPSSSPRRLETLAYSRGAAVPTAADARDPRPACAASRC